ATSSGHLHPATTLTALGGLYLATRQTSALAALTSASGNILRYMDALAAFTTSNPTLPAANPVTTTFTSLRLENVGFTYPAGHHPALNDISLTVHAGQIIALVGENGSGKTTLAKLLAGLYRPTTGTIHLNSHPVHDPTQLRAVSAVLFQDFLRYKLTIADNITLGRPDHTHNPGKLDDAAHKAGADTFTTLLPDGYHTQLGSEYHSGTDLSGGQWQRLALARTLYRNAPLIVLDEPTAAMDPHAEAALSHTLRTLCKDRTVILISHRLSSIRHTDHIYVLDKGHIVEHGTHSELTAAHSTYTHLFHTQTPTHNEPGKHVPNNMPK
ncbi:ABC transporter ATP-binding protein, partial [Streptomyces virginiae]|uniref:ABC transporter ATP-binding protein n=1 Tax=Streptomyces virginiae TaxID=1961 RepID=UPI00332895D0